LPHYWIRQDAVRDKKYLKQVSIFCSPLTFHYLFIKQDAVRHNQIEKLIFHLFLRSPFTIFVSKQGIVPMKNKNLKNEL